MCPRLLGPAEPESPGPFLIARVSLGDGILTVATPAAGALAHLARDSGHHGVATGEAMGQPGRGHLAVSVWARTCRPDRERTRGRGKFAVGPVSLCVLVTLGAQDCPRGALEPCQAGRWDLILTGAQGHKGSHITRQEPNLLTLGYLRVGPHIQKCIRDKETSNL